jgi:opacity protein-like surface antigen
MATLKALTLAGGALLVLTRFAGAADLLPPPPALEPLPAAMAPEFSGWYLRGDVGISGNATPAQLVNTPNPLPGTNPGGFAYSAATTQGFSNTTLSGSGMFDFGVGYQFNPWLRGDVTVEYRNGGHLQSLWTLNDPTPPTTQYADFYRADTSSLIGLFNAYADLGTWYGITPFVGAGIGFARNTLFGFTDQGFGYYTGASLGPSGGYFDNHTTDNFAWALMTGLDFNVTQNLKLELGSRYLNMGKIATGGSNCLSGSCSGGVTNYVSSKNTLASNDFRLGLRWMISEQPTYAPAPEPAPLVRKY